MTVITAIVAVTMWEDGYNRALKKATIRNNMEQLAYHKSSRSIDAERRALMTRRTRQEGEMRAKLHRLQLEQRLSSGFDDAGD